MTCRLAERPTVGRLSASLVGLIDELNGVLSFCRSAVREICPNATRHRPCAVCCRSATGCLSNCTATAGVRPEAADALPIGWCPVVMSQYLTRLRVNRYSQNSGRPSRWWWMIELNLRSTHSKESQIMISFLIKKKNQSALFWEDTIPSALNQLICSLLTYTVLFICKRSGNMQTRSDGRCAPKADWISSSEWYVSLTESINHQSEADWQTKSIKKKRNKVVEFPCEFDNSLTDELSLRIFLSV